MFYHCYMSVWAQYSKPDWRRSDLLRLDEVLLSKHDGGDNGGY